MAAQLVVRLVHVVQHRAALAALVEQPIERVRETREAVLHVEHDRVHRVRGFPLRGAAQQVLLDADPSLGILADAQLGAPSVIRPCLS